MKKVSAFYRPAQEEKNGYLGKATITIADAIQLNGISVFRSSNNDAINLRFPDFEVSDEKRLSYVTPKSPEAYARLCSVVAHAIENENHFAFLPGTYLKNEPGERLEVHGKPVQEQYADARFYVEVADMVVLNGIRTNREAFEKNGKTGHYTQVKMPTINSYEVDGEKRYQKAFEGRIRTGTLEDGTNYSIDYGDLLQGLILAERKVVLNLDRKTSLDDKMKAAEASKAEPAANAAPVQEAERA